MRFDHHDRGTPEEFWQSAPQWSRLPEVHLDPTELDRLIVVAAHPDDETLGASGLIAAADAAGIDVTVVLLSRGDQSHPGSPTYSPAQLAQVRLAESRHALDEVAPGAAMIDVGLPDGSLGDHEQQITAEIVRAIGTDGHRVLLVAPWRSDGHPDHEIAGHCASVAALRTDASCLHFPIWLWHWGTPDVLPWERVRLLSLDPATMTHKRAAIAAHASQTAPLSPDPRDAAVLHEHMLAHFLRPYETFIAPHPAVDDALDLLHREDADPWQTDTSWYEQRKRDIALACLPARRFARAIEIGCSSGALTEALASRCDHLLAVDQSAAAIARATERLRQTTHVELLNAVAPDELPDERFDLMIISEVGYFVSMSRLRRLAAWAERSLQPAGAVLLCHWRHPASGWPLDGDHVHDLWSDSTTLHRAVEHLEDDFRISVFTDSRDHRHGAP